jgi:hypothetical protein
MMINKYNKIEAARPSDNQIAQQQTLEKASGILDISMY